jgi:hypothetical protein
MRTTVETTVTLKKMMVEKAVVNVKIQTNLWPLESQLCIMQVQKIKNKLHQILHKNNRNVARASVWQCISAKCAYSANATCDSHLVTPQTCVYLEVNLDLINERQFKAPKVLYFLFLFFNMKLLNPHLTQKLKRIEIVNLLI